jgi:hypothetical protein
MQIQIFLNEQRLLEKRFWIGKLSCFSDYKEFLPGKEGYISCYRRPNRAVRENGLKRKLYQSEMDSREMFTGRDDVMENSYCIKYLRG